MSASRGGGWRRARGGAELKEVQIHAGGHGAADVGERELFAEQARVFLGDGADLVRERAGEALEFHHALPLAVHVAAAHAALRGLVMALPDERLDVVLEEQDGRLRTVIAVEEVHRRREEVADDEVELARTIEVADFPGPLGREIFLNGVGEARAGVVDPELPDKLERAFARLTPAAISAASMTKVPLRRLTA